MAGATDGAATSTGWKVMADTEAEASASKITIRGGGKAVARGAKDIRMRNDGRKKNDDEEDNATVGATTTMPAGAEQAE